jgi:hypothetical protein
MVLVTRDEPPKVLQPADRAFDLPAAAKPPQPAAVLGRRSDPIGSMGTDQLDASTQQSSSQRVAVRCKVVKDSFGQPAQLSFLKQRLDQRYFVGAGARDMDAQRKAVSVAMHHDLGAFAAFGLADAFAPFFAEANVPSAIVSSVSTCPRESSRRNRRDQARCQIPACVQASKRRQQVLGEGKCVGRSFQRAPLRRIQRMPSTQGRVGARGRPPLAEGAGSGKRSLIRSHCSSVSSDWGSILDPAWASNAPLSRDRDMSDLLRHSLLRKQTHDRLASISRF